MDKVIIILLAVLTVLAAVILIMLIRKGKDDKTEENIRRELELKFGENRRETAESIGRIGETVSQNNGVMMKTISDSLFGIGKANSEQSDKIARQLADSLEKLTQSNEKKLDEMKQTVDERLTQTVSSRIESSFKSVSERLENLHKSLGEMTNISADMTSSIGSLNHILTNVKTRGTFAEIQLENILEQTLPNMYIRNFSPQGMRSVVEFAIKIYGSDGGLCYLPLDSKFPVEDYRRLSEAVENCDKAAADEARKQLERSVLAQAKNVEKYISVPETSPFAVMYLATDGLFAEIASSQNGIIERAYRENHVIISGPSTIAALLNTIAAGYTTVTLNRRAAEVSEMLAAFKSAFEKFKKDLDTAQSKINGAGESVTKLLRDSESVSKALRGIELPDDETTE